MVATFYPVNPLPRPMELVERIRMDELPTIVRVERQTQGLGPRPDPVQGDIGQPSLLVAPTDVAVHTGEPLLLDGLTPYRTPRPECRLEVNPLLVDGDRVAGVFDDLAERCVVKRVAAIAGNGLQDLAGDTERTDRVPDADERDACRPGMHAPKLQCCRLIRIRSRPVELVGVWDLVSIDLLEQSGVANEPDKTPDRVRSAAEAEQVDLVTRCVVVYEKPVGVLNVLVEPGAEHAARDLLAIRSHAPVVENDLWHAVRVGRPHRLCRAYDVGHVTLFRAVPSAVTADNETLPVSSHTVYLSEAHAGADVEG